MAQQPLARSRRPHRPRRPIDQHMPHRLFQPAELLADGRLGHVQPLRRDGEAAAVGDRDKGTEQARIEHGIPFGS